ncbi:hypothetical protein [Streptomyces yanii]|uniref:Uncharacterized protein n=1 Tax=Streptomyces yanii TaxID=78510 RepID=A0ABV5RPP8_9ACTN
MNIIGAFTPQLLQTAAEGRPADLINTWSIAAKNVFPKFADYPGTMVFVTHMSVQCFVTLDESRSGGSRAGVGPWLRAMRVMTAGRGWLARGLEGDLQQGVGAFRDAVNPADEGVERHVILGELAALGLLDRLAEAGPGMS